MASLLQRPWSWSGPGKTFGTATLLRDSLALAITQFYPICNAGKDHNTLMHCSIFLLQRSKSVATLRRAPNRIPVPSSH
jgi:hypothetical protein